MINHNNQIPLQPPDLLTSDIYIDKVYITDCSFYNVVPVCIVP